jgi:xylan 1,4-beta-xylosidase
MKSNDFKIYSMTKIYFSVLCLLLAISAQAQFQSGTFAKDAKFYQNPVFAGDYPDPSILKDGDKYYMVHSSFEYYPGLLIWQSADLINWSPVTNSLQKYVGSVWAPDLVKYKNNYYIYFPANDKIFVIKSASISGPWSEPVAIEAQGIDPGHVVDAHGNRYLYFSNGGYVQLSEDGLTAITPLKHVYGGWPIPRDWTIECFCLESPKICKRGEYYYLTVAEGGTAGPATSHMIISARSKSPLGPWENSPYNPILRTKNNSERWWSKGHGTLFEDNKGKWWMLYHAYERGFANMGRQTLLEPVEWTKDGWFKSPAGIVTENKIARPELPASSSNYSLSDDFSGNSLKLHWKFFGEWDTTRFSFKDKSLVVKGKGNSVGNCSPLLCVPSGHSYTAEIEMDIEGKANGGLVLFYNNSCYSGILSDGKDILANLRGWQFVTERDVVKKHVFLKLKNTDNTVDMFYSLDGKNWLKIESSIEVSSLNHNAFGGFLSLRIGLCSIGEGTVKFRNFKYSNN